MAARYFKNVSSSAIVKVDVEQREKVQDQKKPDKIRYAYNESHIHSLLNNGFVEVDGHDPATAKEIKAKKADVKTEAKVEETKVEEVKTADVKTEAKKELKK